MNLNGNIRNIAVLAHVDAGKTSITEQILYHAGIIKNAGSVDNGNTQSDSLKVEKDRGISVRSSVMNIQWNDCRIHIIDTPGHVDFSSDVQRILQVLDAAILIVSAVDGLQAHTETLWQALKKRGIPVIILLNKCDREGSDVQAISVEIENEWKNQVFLMQLLQGETTAQLNVKSRWNADLMPEDLIEQIVSADELLMEKYLEGVDLGFDTLDSCLIKLIAEAKFSPVLYASAKYSVGIKELLDVVCRYLPVPQQVLEKEFSAVVFALDKDKNLGKMAYLRVFSGKISNRDLILNQRNGEKEKLVQIRRLNGLKQEDTLHLNVGEIGVVFGLSSVRVGDVLGNDSSLIPQIVQMHTALLTVQVKAVETKDYAALAAALLLLQEEDPSLEVDWLREESELHVRVSGWIQMEVLERVLLDRFALNAVFEKPTVIYKETPAKGADGFVRYWMPKPSWAIMKFRIEPGELGSGLVYESLIGVDDVAQKYQNEVERSIPEALKQGIKGWEVSDIRISLIEGEDHEIHSRPGNFKTATPMGIMDALSNSGTILLEPYVSFLIKANEELLGSISSDIIKMRGSFESPEINNGLFFLKGELPLSTSQDYSVKLSSRSGGKASVSIRFIGYRPCSDEEGVIRPYKGISPLDHAKWILKARGAME